MSNEHFKDLEDTFDVGETKETPQTTDIVEEKETLPAETTSKNNIITALKKLEKSNEITEEVIAELMNIAKSSEDPAAFNVVLNAAKVLSGNSKIMVDIETKKGGGNNSSKGGDKYQGNIFVGSFEEALKIANTIDVTPKVEDGTKS